MMRILIAPDKFKGSLSAMEVCQAIAEGLKQNDKQYIIHTHPMADGGDGSLEVLERHLNLKQQIMDTCDPLGRPIRTFYYRSANIAFIEMAKASGLVLLQEKELNPLKTSTLGTGKMIVDAISKGCDEVCLFLGGSATNDGGMGIAAALGVRFFDDKKNVLSPCGENLSKVDSIAVPPSFDIEKIKFTLLSDVNNPLFGPNGAAPVYARQKGADDAMVQILDEGLKHFSETLFYHTGIAVVHLSGSGAAGGIAASLVPIFKANIKSGVDRFAALTDLESQIQKADLVISGEGKIDGQSLQGKVIDGVAQLCEKHNKPLVLFVGKNDLSEKGKQKLNARQIFAVLDQASSFSDAMNNASMYLKRFAQVL